MRNKYFWIFIGCFFIFLLFLAYFLPLMSYQEAKRAVIIQETIYKKNFLFPQYNGNPYLTKPPLYTWFSFPFFLIGNLIKNYLSLSEIFFLRLFSILSYLFLVLLIFIFWQKDFQKSLISILILFSSFRFLSFSIRIDPEPFFIFSTFLLFYSFCCYLKTFRNFHKWFFYFLLAFCFLIRGPLHFFLLPALLFYGLIFKEKKVFRLFLFFPGWILIIFLIIPWYIEGYLHFGEDVFAEFINEDLKQRLFCKNSDPFYCYVEAMFLNFPLYFLFLFLNFKKFLKNKIKLLKTDYLFLLSFAIPVLLLSFTGKKFDKYLLFLYPFVALFFTNIFLKIYSSKFILKVGLFCFLLNFIAFTGITTYKIKNLKSKVELVKSSINPKEEYIFYKKENPLFIYYYKKPISVVSARNYLKIYFPKKIIISKEKIPYLKILKIVPDPYKKKQVWYFMKYQLSSKKKI